MRKAEYAVFEALNPFFESFKGFVFCFRHRLAFPRRSLNSDPQRAAEPSTGIVRFRTVVIYENSVVAAITKEGPAEFSDFGRCFHPARRFRIELSKFLQLAILVFS